jgi:tripartite-type tricarboxylate transporter receptor subunit TctC
MAGVEMVHVPYRGTAPAHTDLLSGQVQLLFDAMPSSIALINAGKLRALAVTTAQRSPAMPNLPTVGEFLPGYEASSWWGIGAPAGTPPAIVERLQRELARSLAQPAFRKKFDDVGMEPITRTFAEFVASLPGETRQWAKVIKEAGIKPGE